MKLTSFVIVVLAATSGLSPCSAFGAVDQQHTPIVPFTYVNVGSNNDVDWSQTFTVGEDGYLLGFDTWVYRFPEITLPLLFDIRRTNGAIPTEPDSGSDLFASGVVAAMDVPILPPTNEFPEDFVQIVLESPVLVTAGDILAVTLHSDDPGVVFNRWAYSWIGNWNGTYQGGTAFVRVGPSFANPTNGWIVASSNIDLGFKTYLAPIPEPNTSVVFLIAVVGSCSRVRPKRC